MHRHIMDVADDHDAAVTAVLAAAQAATDDARICLVSTSPCYELRAASQLVAIIQTGADEAGNPDHAATAALLQRIEIERSLSAAQR